jgi:hypothetical protein
MENVTMNAVSHVPGPLWPWIFRESGFPFCHVRCAQSYWIVEYDLGGDHETSFKLGLN